MDTTSNFPYKNGSDAFASQFLMNTKEINFYQDFVSETNINNCDCFHGNGMNADRIKLVKEEINRFNQDVCQLQYSLQLVSSQMCWNTTDKSN